ncbi:MAG: hypothetical protein HYX90_03715 [Chloroflexi bacterium]|nr:hypothetical protein [Chloroflexota bacterium]
MPSRPYAGEEVLTFDRIRRGVTNRVLEVASKALDEGSPLDRQHLLAAVTEEWKAVKEAVRNSPSAREKARERIRMSISGILDNHVKSDRGELESLGVQDKNI